ncbi:MAG: T9SS type A sorting domain-containing protein [Bacteroidales bacterium]
MRKFLLSFFFVAALMNLMAAPVQVTFNVNMAPAGLNGEQVWIAGNFGGDWGTWNEPGTNPNCEMTDPDGDGYFSITMLLEPGDYQFKFFKGSGWAGGEWDGEPNRVVTITGAWDHYYTWGQKIQDQQVLADFEDGTWGILTPHVMGCGEYDDINVHAIEETFMVVDNPAPDAMNSSAKVLKFKRWGTAVSASPWGGFWANLMPYADVQVNKYVHVKLWKPEVSPVKFKLENGPSGTLEIASVNAQQLTGQWEEFVFDYSEKFSQFKIAVLLPDFPDSFTRVDPIDIYIDDIVINSNPNTSNGIINNNKVFMMYPNPVKDKLYIENFGRVERIAIYNLAGQMVKMMEPRTSSKVSVDFSDLNAGLYLVNVVNSEGKSVTHKIQK